MVNILTIDVEEWYHATMANILNSSTSSLMEQKVVEPTLKILHYLEKTNNNATFFILGEVAEKNPALILKIKELGHEVASHGYSHKLIYDMTEDEFMLDIKRSKDLLEKIINDKIIGFRAPSFYADIDHKWFWKTLYSCGLKYDSSMYPFKTFLYGNNKNPRFVFDKILDDGQIIKEIPPSSGEFLKIRFPFSGGFYFRFFPYHYTKFWIKKINSINQPVVIYLHPWELDSQIPRLKTTFVKKIILYVNIETTEKKLLKLLNDFKFTSIVDYYFK